MVAVARLLIPYAAPLELIPWWRCVTNNNPIFRQGIYRPTAAASDSGRSGNWKLNWIWELFGTTGRTTQRFPLIAYIGRVEASIVQSSLFGKPYNLRRRHPAMPENVVHSTFHWPPLRQGDKKMKITRLLAVFFVLFGSAITLSHAGSQSVSAAAKSHTLTCCDLCPPLCPAK